MPNALNLRTVEVVHLPAGPIEIVAGSLEHVSYSAPSPWSVIEAQAPQLCLRFVRADTGSTVTVQAAAVIGIEGGQPVAAQTTRGRVADTLLEAQSAPRVAEHAHLETNPGPQPGTRTLSVRIPAGRRLPAEALGDIVPLLADRLPGPMEHRPHAVSFVVGGATTADVRLAQILQDHPLEPDLIPV